MRDYAILWSDAARRDLEEIVAFIAAENPTGALKVLAQIEDRCANLARLPERGRIVPELKSIDVFSYRELVEGPWRIVYRRDARRVYVIAILDARRNLSSILLERLTR